MIARANLLEHRSGQEGCSAVKALQPSFHCSWHKGKLDILTVSTQTPQLSLSPLTFGHVSSTVVLLLTSSHHKEACLGQITPIISPYKNIYLSFVAFVTAAV